MLIDRFTCDGGCRDRSRDPVRCSQVSGTCCCLLNIKKIISHSFIHLFEFKLTSLSFHSFAIKSDSISLVWSIWFIQLNIFNRLNRVLIDLIDLIDRFDLIYIINLIDLIDIINLICLIDWMALIYWMI